MNQKVVFLSLLFLSGIVSHSAPLSVLSRLFVASAVLGGAHSDCLEKYNIHESCGSYDLGKITPDEAAKLNFCLGYKVRDCHAKGGVLNGFDCCVSAGSSKDSSPVSRYYYYGCNSLD